MISGAATIIKSTGTGSGWLSSEPLLFEAPEIGLNSGAPGSAATITDPTVPQPFTLTDILDTAKIGDIWKHEVASESTAQSIIPKIPTHEPSDSLIIVPLVSTTGQPSKKV